MTETFAFDPQSFKRHGAQPDECDGHRVGAHAVAGDAAGGVGGAYTPGGSMTEREIREHDARGVGRSAAAALFLPVK